MKDNIKTFVEKNVDNNPRKMRSSLFLVNFFPMLGIAYGLIIGSVYRMFSVLIAASIVVSFIIIFMLTKRCTVVHTIKSSICLNLFTASNYLLFAMILYSMYNKMQLGLILLFLPLLLVAFLTAYFTVRFLKKDKALYSKRKNVTIASVTSAISVITYLVLKRLTVDIEQSSALLIATVFLTLLSSLFVVFGVWDAIKLYYIKKFCIAFEE